MALLKIKCPECSAGLKSPTGFKVGQNVRCPKCETYFAVEEPEDEAEDAPPPKKAATGKKVVAAESLDDDDDDAPKPKKKKKKRVADDDDDDDGRSYKNSPLRFAILGVLVVVMLVLGYMLYDKRKKEKADDVASNSSSTDSSGAPVNPLPPPKTGPAGVQLGGNNGPPRPGIGGPGGGPGGGPPLGGLLGGGGGLDPQAANALKLKLQTRLVGTWTADLGDGYREEVTYTADGSYTAKLTGPMPASAGGKYTVLQAVGTKGLKLQLGGPAGKTVTVNFDDDALEQPSLRVGYTGAYRKK